MPQTGIMSTHGKGARPLACEVLSVRVSPEMRAHVAGLAARAGLTLTERSVTDE
jgi:hypothetical protein